MDEPPELEHNGHWKMAVRALRVGLVGLSVIFVGLIVSLLGSTAWILAAGMIIWLAAVAVTLTEFSWARHQLPEPRPSYWSMRLMIIDDAVHVGSSMPRS